MSEKYNDIALPMLYKLHQEMLDKANFSEIGFEVQVQHEDPQVAKCFTEYLNSKPVVREVENYLKQELKNGISEGVL